MKIVLVKKS